MDAQTDREQVSLTDLLVKLAEQGLFTADAVLQGLQVYTEQLEDLRWVSRAGSWLLSYLLVLLW